MWIERPDPDDRQRATSSARTQSPEDLSAFLGEILPGLVKVPVPAIAAATGLLVGSCRRAVAGLARHIQSGGMRVARSQISGS